MNVNILSMHCLMWFALLMKVVSLRVESNSLSGTESSFELTDKQLSIQRWFSQLTFLNQNVDDWTGWGEVIEDLHCDGNTCIRYEISGLAYAVAAMAHRTPAYSEVVIKILKNCIFRMLSKKVWQYVELFNDFKSQPSYPDPVAYKNIMYSGHLAQVCYTSLLFTQRYCALLPSYVIVLS